MTNENSKDQLVLAPKLAELFANNELFVSEIGLEQFGPEERHFQLEPRIGFILAMHRTMKSIFRYQPHSNLDDKFVTLIHSRISLIPEQVEEYPDPNEYARQCYIEIKESVKESGVDWYDLSLKEKFFEVCLRTEVEEEKLLLTNSTDTENEFWKIGHRNIFTLLFEKIFESVNWELDDKVEPRQVNENEKVILSPKKAPGPDSRLKEYPLLYLYFDDFAEIKRTWNKGHFEVGMDDIDIQIHESFGYSLDEIMSDENLFLRLYKHKLVRLRLWDGTVLLRDDEEFYWDRVTHPEKYTDEISHLRDPGIIAWRKETLKEIDAVVASIKLRYGL